MASIQMWTSKLGNKYPKDQIERLDQEHHQLLKALRKLPHNSRCAECTATDTTWASVSLGVFVCVRCSDVHRAVGTHISKVKGCSGTYLWGPDELARMQEMGNARAEELYGSPPPPAESASKEERVAVCARKYGRAPAAAAAPTPPRQAPCAAGPPAEAGAAAAAGPMVLRPAPCADEDPFAPRARAWRAAAAPPHPAGLPRAPAVAKALEAPDVDDLFRSLETCGTEAAAAGTKQAARRAPVAAVGDLDAFLDQCLLQGGKPAPEPARVVPVGVAGPAPDDDFFSNWL